MNVPSGLILLTLACLGRFAYADNEDARQLKEQTQWQIKSKEQSQLVEEKPTVTDTINIDGTEYAVKDNDQDLTRALFYTINQQQWARTRTYLQRYKNLPHHAEVMVLFAEASLDKADGKLAEAENKYQRLLAIDPDFMRGRLELARVMFENKKTRESKTAFQGLASLANIPDEIKPNVQGYLGAINVREKWNTYLSVSYGYDSNINKASGKTGCVSFFPGMPCVPSQTTPIQKSAVSKYQVSLSKLYPIYGQHNISLLAMQYGSFYPNHRPFTEHTGNVYLGYNFANARHDLTVSPVAEFQRNHSHQQNRSFGARVEYSYLLNPKTNLNFQYERKNTRFTDQGHARINDGKTDTFTITMMRQLTEQLAVFGGVDYTRKRVNDKTASFDLKGGRAGVYYGFNNGAGITAMSIFRKYDHQAANLFISPNAARNKEYIQMININLKNLSYHGIYPSLNLKMTRLTSNNDWFYDYRRKEIAISLQKSF